jgi:hypothetical protein
VEQTHLWKSTFILGIVLVTISFNQGTLLSENGGILIYENSAHEGYLFHCSEVPYLTLNVRQEKLVSLYVMTTEESSRFIDGIPIEDVSIAFSLVNISEYAGPMNLGGQGLYILFVTTFNQSESTIEYDYLSFELKVFRQVPNFLAITTGLIFLVLSSLLLYPRILEFRRLKV